MFQILIQNILGTFRKKTEKGYPFPTSRPEDSLKKEPILDPISKQTHHSDVVDKQVTDSVTVAVSEPVVEKQVAEEPTKKKKTTNKNGSKTTKRKSKQ